MKATVLEIMHSIVGDALEIFLRDDCAESNISFADLTTITIESMPDFSLMEATRYLTQSSKDTVGHFHLFLFLNKEGKPISKIDLSFRNEELNEKEKARGHRSVPIGEMIPLSLSYYAILRYERVPMLGVNSGYDAAKGESFFTHPDKHLLTLYLPRS